MPTETISWTQLAGRTLTCGLYAATSARTQIVAPAAPTVVESIGGGFSVYHFALTYAGALPLVARLWDGGVMLQEATIDATVSSRLAAASYVAPDSTVGPGATPYPFDFKDDASGIAIADADVWVSTDAAGIHVVAGTRQTNSGGRVVFLLDAGEAYFLWMQKDGVNSIVAQPFTVPEDD